MIPIITDLRNAYEAHDHDEFHRHLKRLEAMLRYTGPAPTPLTSDPVAEATRNEMQRRLDQAKP
jgi:hypothetical protein